MIKVLHKVFDIIEFLAESPERPRSLMEIARHLEQHPATCANILKTLMRRNYIEQVAPKKGYLLGPALFQVSRKAPYRKDLIAAAEPLMAKLAQSVNETVILVTVRMGRRFVLSQINGQQHIQVAPQALIEDNLYDTATGRLLLAYMPERELDKLTAEYSLQASKWPVANNPAVFKETLAKIRKSGKVVHKPNPDMIGIAFPIQDQRSEVIASLGLFLPSFRFKGDHRKKVLSGLQQTAAAINLILAGYPPKTFVKQTAAGTIESRRHHAATWQAGALKNN